MVNFVESLTLVNALFNFRVAVDYTVLEIICRNFFADVSNCNGWLQLLLFTESSIGEGFREFIYK